ncbi:DUF2529 family protein [Salibacterium salarium]|uniref:DUF2529 family protein n=1 Tax=Salibacterium salarium TaxID=284579 RepID=A0A3R9WLF6_9BACI|nr:DUF2529 family protein [Salibacterium salarium]RSL28910.1 DUF2529 family protein [Salibacterium salarium]
MKVFATQLQGVFNKVLEEEEAVEDGSRLLAQGPGGTGTLWISGTASMEGNAITLASHPDAPAGTKVLQNIGPTFPDSNDRVLVLAEKGESLTTIVTDLKQKEVPVVVIAPYAEEDGEVELEPTDVWLHTHVRGGIVPDEDGNRMGSPSALCTLFAGQLLFLNMREMLEELD